jgi:hypothetical protein
MSLVLRMSFPHCLTLATTRFRGNDDASDTTAFHIVLEAPGHQFRRHLWLAHGIHISRETPLSSGGFTPISTEPHRLPSGNSPDSEKDSA